MENIGKNSLTELSQLVKSNLKILILQEDSSAEPTVSILHQAGYVVNFSQASTVKEYRSYLSPQLDLILYHADLTQLTLTEAIDLLLENNLKIPLLVVNGVASIPHVIAAIKTGATDYIPGTELERLPAAVAQALAAPDTCYHLAKCTQETEQQLVKLIQDNPDGIIVVDDRGIVQFINSAALQLFGKSEAELIGEPLGFPVVNDEYLEVDIPQKNPKSTLIAQMRASRIRWQGTNAHIVSLRNITQIKQAEAERAKLLEEAQAANRAKDQFLAILSHELRTPLNPIVGWSQLLQTGTLSKAQMERGIEIIRRNAMLQSQLIEDILDISRIIRGKIELQAAPVKLSTVINNALDTVKLAAQAKSIPINTDLDKNADLVRGDSIRLQQIIWNLLTNAIKFTPNGGRVDIKLSLVTGDLSLVEDDTQIPNGRESKIKNKFAQIQIIDTGKGIKPEFLPYVFDYFRQAENAKTRATGGLGLGLAIVRHLVELHGGTVRVDSPGAGRGATFTITLPLIDRNKKLASTDDSSSTTKNLAGMKALVVDDDDSSRDLLIFVLENEGITTKSAALATDALNLIEQFQPDLLISDIAMPGMDGHELIKKVKDSSAIQGENLIAIALSAYASDRDRQISLAAGFDCHINKPLDVNNFLQVLTKLLD
ncbi:MAG: hypothetical protein Tsb0014_06550 [Pleurocapsa sp.]